MRSIFKGRLSVFTLLLAVSLVSCEHAVEPQAQTTLQEELSEPQELLGLLSGETKVKARGDDGRIRQYTLVKEPVLSLDLLNLRVSQVIGIEGGELTLLGHTVRVPAGAVDVPALFTMIVLPTGYVHVDLTALTGSVLGSLLNIGAEGFKEPVRLELTYSRATNVRDESRLVILRMDPRGLGYVHEALPSEVDPRNDLVSVWLDHFSAYCMAQ